MHHFDDVICMSCSPYVTPHDDLTTLDYTTSTLYWSSIESSLSVLCACLPMLRPLFSAKVRHTTDGSYPSNQTSSWKSRARRLEEGDGESLHSSTGLREDHGTGLRREPAMGLDTSVTTVPLKDLPQIPVDDDRGNWVQKELSKSTGWKAESL